MKLNMSKMVFLNTIILSCLISFSTNNWLTIWIMMETSLFMFIPLMSKNKINDQSMKYFIVQSTSSYILIFSIMWTSVKESNLNSLMTLISLMIKIGMPPFHIWKPEIMKNLKWTECMVLTTLNKIPPMIMLNKLINLNLLTFPLTMALVVGGISGLNQLNLKKMMAYSSIFNVSWMTSSFMTTKKTMLTFLIMYSMLNIKTMIFFKKNNLMFKNQLNYISFKKKMILNLNLLSISGLPPLTGFYPKWIILNEMVKTSLYLSTFMILTSTITIFMYTQINMFSISNLMTKKKSSKMFFSKNFSFINILVLPIMLILWTF
uniref:NADH-ubiquinone oxidoreductase chain 2 n=1 Tax=Ishiharodelphax matsuyamensis TaxID=871437 RepID=A0A7S4Z0M9_9HEMI|nr:NADH dehydrogenase subunit 2 [Ishiharodelphax matsuyamensis]QBZ38017.1 NADH dehydrogenase subunit 2 [Ishiharodelphax matsuyamensis]